MAPIGSIQRRIRDPSPGSWQYSAQSDDLMSGGRLNRELVDGLYEEVLTETLRARLSRIGDQRVAVVEKLPTALVADHLARAIHDAARLALHSLHGDKAVERQLELANNALRAIARTSQSTAGDDSSTLLAQMLLSLATPSTLTGIATSPARPLTALSRSELFVNGEQRGVIQELLSEIASADRIDLLMSFIKWSGFVKFRDALADHCVRRASARGANGEPVPSLRVLTTTYLGASEARAIEGLRELGAEVRISYETTQTRLHAKAWLFHRDTGLSTAYIGSSNLSHAALTDGLEWNVRLANAELPHLVERFAGVFARYWRDPAAGFELYDAQCVERLRGALLAARGHAGAQGGHMPLFRVEPRDYQKQMLEDLHTAREVHDRHRNLVVAATGTGKTVLAAFDYKHLRATPAKIDSLLFVAHRKEILDQSRRVFAQVLGQSDRWGELLTGDDKPLIGRHVFASIQSLDRILKDRPPAADAFDMVIVDEVHHAAADTYERLLTTLKPRELLGLTATPERTDGLDIGKFFERPWAAELRVWDAIERQILVPFNYFGVDLPNVDVSAAWERGRYRIGALSQILSSAHIWVDQVVRSLDRYVRDASQMRALAFCVDQAHAHFVAERLNAAKLCAVALTANDSWERRSEVVRSFASDAADRPRVLCVVDLFNEGVDIPSVDTLLLLRPTDSATLFIQQLGRGLRRTDGKDCLTVLDYVAIQHDDFRFEDRYRALLGMGRKQLKDGLTQGFARLPSGCSVKLEPVAMKQVLRRLETSLERSTRSLARRLGQLPPTTTLREFLDAEGLALGDLYRNRRSWTALQREAGRPLPAIGEAEEGVLANLQALTHVDDLERLIVLRELALDTFVPTHESALRRARMALTVLFDRKTAGDVDARLAELRGMHCVRAELSALVEALTPGARLVEVCPRLPSVIPLRLHASYLTEEIAAAFDLRTSEGGIQLPQAGVVNADHDQYKADLLLVKLDKAASSKVPHLQYEDYAISPTRFHWESQAATHQADGRGQRHIDHVALGVTPLLFVRETGKDDRGLALPYRFLGPVARVHHEGECPIRIEWELESPMPAAILTRARVAVA